MKWLFMLYSPYPSLHYVSAEVFRFLYAWSRGEASEEEHDGARPLLKER